MMRHGWIIAAVVLPLLSGCTTEQQYQASVDQACRQQARYKSNRYYACLRRAAVADYDLEQQRLANWGDVIDDFRAPVVYGRVR